MAGTAASTRGRLRINPPKQVPATRPKTTIRVRRPPQHPFRFLDLPAEIRLNVYSYAIPQCVNAKVLIIRDHEVFVLRSNHDEENVPAVMRACRAMYLEALPVFYDHVRFRVRVTGPTIFLRDFEHKFLSLGSISACKALQYLRRADISIVDKGEDVNGASMLSAQARELTKVLSRRPLLKSLSITFSCSGAGRNTRAVHMNSAVKALASLECRCQVKVKRDDMAKRLMDDDTYAAVLSSIRGSVRRS